MNEILKKIQQVGIVPVIALENADDAKPLAEALCNGGLPIAEVTYRTSAAHDVIVNMKKACPDMLVGAGTVLTTEQVDSAIDAGAQFIVSPGINPKIVEYCLSKDIPIVPGVSCASEIELGLSYGLEVLKFFPAEQLGGLSMISALAGPYTKVKFMPTGGINIKNVNDYLSNPKILACGGTWMIDKQAIKDKNFDKIEEITHEAVKTMLNIKIKHIGINGEKDAEKVAEHYAKLFQGNMETTSKSYFGSSWVEVMHPNAHVGTHGHIAIGVNSTERAMAYFKSMGYTFDESSIAYDENGLAKLAYFTDEVGGFKVHLVNN